ncbi:MAG: hypothetical protein ABH871_00215 [Pseudomonadota bacterium]
MKTIVVAGACSDVGKTTVLRKIRDFFSDSISVKLGKSEAFDKNKEELLLPSDSSIDSIKHALPRQPAYLLIEGNSILKRFDPDLSIFVDGDGPDRRPDADELKKKCDLIVGKRIDCKQAFGLAGKSGLSLKEFGKLLNKIDVKVTKCQLGCF